MGKLQYLSYKVKQKLGQRGAEMVEYAIVLACIAAVAVFFYTINHKVGGTTMKMPTVISHLWEKINLIIPK